MYGYGWAVNGMLPGAQPNTAQKVKLIPDTNSAKLVSVCDRLACLVKDTGALHCWGSAISGLDIATPIGGLPPVTWVAVRGQKACAVLQAGDVYCLDGGGKFALSLAAIGATPWVGVTVGLEHYCAWQLNGQVRCWGNGAVFAQLGTGTPLPLGSTAASDALPVKSNSSTPLTNVTQMCAGLHHSCARTGDNKVHCWGYGLYGQIGNGSFASAPFATKVTGSGQGQGGFSALQVHCGDNTTYAQDPTHQYVVWGRGELGQVGNSGFKDVATWTKPNGLQVEPRGGQSANAACAVQGLELRCWGSNESGVLGRYDPGAALDPQVPSAVLRAEDGIVLTNATALHGVGGLFVVDTTAGRFAFGNATGGGAMTGQSSKILDGATPTLPPQHPFARLGPGIGCTLDDNSAISCWGANGQQHVTGKMTNPAQLEVPVTISTTPAAKALFVGVSHSCATTTDNAAELRCWGRNQDGELGNGTVSGAMPITTVPDAKNVGGIALGPGRTCAFGSNNDIYCWGANKYGEAGVANAGAVTLPQKVGGPPMTGVAVSACVSCAISADDKKEVYCWGYNGGTSSNYLGTNNSITNTHTPQKVVGIQGALAVAITDYSTTGVPCAGAACAVLANGSVRCWGGSSDALLGTGNAGTIPAAQQPTTVSGVSGAKSIIAGDRSFCVLTGAANVLCWGQRGGGQTGENVSISAVPTNYPSGDDQ